VKRPSEHIITLTDKNGRFTAMLVKKSPFSDVEERVAAWAATNPYFGSPPVPN
jgi:hypothetical protein